jgi:hypothetical protein
MQKVDVLVGEKAPSKLVSFFVLGIMDRVSIKMNCNIV